MLTDKTREGFAFLLMVHGLCRLTLNLACRVAVVCFDLFRGLNLPNFLKRYGALRQCPENTLE